MRRRILFRRPALALGIRLVWLTILALSFVYFMPVNGMAQQTPGGDSGKIVIPEGPIDFRGCVELALRQSPYLVSSRVEIDLKHIDEKDSKYSFIPTLSMHSSYYFSTPQGQSPYSLQFYSDPYNPFESYFTLQARKVLTEMAALAHQQSIAEFIFHLARNFLELDGQTRMEAIQQESLELARRNVAFTAGRIKTGTGSSTESRLAEQETEVAEMDRDGMSAAIVATRDNIKSILGVPQEVKLELSVQDAKQQVLGGFDPASATFSEVQSNSIQLRLQTLKRELQSKNITLAKMKYMPVFNFGIENANPLSGVNNNDSIYVTAGVTVPIWDNMSRLRNVTRQKLILQQYEAEENIRAKDLNSKWNATQLALRNAALQLKIAQGQLEIATIKEQRTEIGYKEGRQPFSDLVAEQRGKLAARKAVEAGTVEYNKAVLEIRYQSGELFGSYVQPKF